MDDRETLIWLNSIHISSMTIEKMLCYFKKISVICDMSNEDIINLNFIDNKSKEKIIKNKKNDVFKQYMENVYKLDLKVMTVLDADYPKVLKNIYNPPKVLYIKGSFQKEDFKSIGIVGSRKATYYGKWASRKLAGELAKMGITVISGMARGIDTEAHKGSLKENGRTIAVLGSGIDVIYPKSNISLYDEISKNGCIISEFPIGTQPFPYNFPNRNRIISGLSLGLLVVEAAERSGSLITAEHALEQGKEVFAVPGNINSIYSRGTNNLIKEGAKLVMDVDDIFEEIYELQDIINKEKNDGIDYSVLSPLELKIVECIKEQPIHSDVISYKTGIDISTLNGILTILEMKGIIEQLPGKIYTIH